MNAETQAIRDATGAVVTVLEGLSKVRCLANDDRFDDQLDRFGPMLTNYVAVVFAARPVVAQAAVRLRAASPEVPQSVGKHTAPSYHELALRLAEEPIWHMFRGMDSRCMTVVMHSLSGLKERLIGSITDVEESLIELGGIEEPATALAEIREHRLTDFHISWLLSHVQKEGAIAVAANTDASPPAVSLTESQQDIVALLRRTGHRLTTQGIFDGLADANLLSSEGMTKQALATLVRFGVLTNSQKVSPPGYGLPEWGKS
ncbi:MAG: hypothetical protein ACYC0X_05930 [Pirellulaceae bacterium]